MRWWRRATWDAPLWLAAGGVLSTPKDLTRLLAALANGELVSGESVRRLRTAHARSLATGVGYGCGVAILHHATGVDWVHHDGAQLGTAAAFAWIPERGLAAAAVANAEGELPERLVRAALQWELGVPPDASLHRWPEADPGDLQDCAGRYATPEGRTLEFEARDGRLVLRVGDERVPLEGVGPDHVRAGDRAFRFLRRAGAPWAVAVAHRVIRREGPEG